MFSVDGRAKLFIRLTTRLIVTQTTLLIHKQPKGVNYLSKDVTRTKERSESPANGNSNLAQGTSVVSANCISGNNLMHRYK